MTLLLLLLALFLTTEAKSKFHNLGYVAKANTPFPLPIPYVFKDVPTGPREKPRYVTWKDDEKAFVDRILQRMNKDLKKGNTRCTKDWFRPGNNNDNPVIELIKDAAKSCTSYIGLIQGDKYRQINLPGESGCLTWDSTVHELGHRLGLDHEHNRPDRVEIIDAASIDQKENEISQGSLMVSAFDTGSVMFYNQMGFRTALGQQTSWNLTPRDVESIRFFYSDCQEPGDNAVPICMVNTPTTATGQGQAITIAFSVNLPGNNPVTLTSITDMPQIKSDQAVGASLTTPEVVKVVFTPTEEMVGTQQTIKVEFANGDQKTTCSQTITVMNFPVLREECFGYNAKDPNVCSGHGTCIHQDLCVCKDNYKGKSCETDTLDGFDRIYQSLPDDRSTLNDVAITDQVETWDFNWPNNNVQEFGFSSIDIPLKVKGTRWEDIGNTDDDNTYPKTFTVEWQEEDGTVLTTNAPFTQKSNAKMYGGDIWAGTLRVPTREIIPAKGKLRIFGGDGVTWGQTTDPVRSGAAKPNAHFAFDVVGYVLCKDGYFGAKCEKTCPGGAGFSQCFGNGLCHDGNIGDGKCTCFSDKYDASSGCEKCAAGWTGPRCATRATARLVVTPTSGLTTSRSGSSSKFTVALGSAPTGNVEVTITPSRTGLTVAPQKLTFDANTGTVPQTVTVTGTNAGDVGDQTFSLALAVTTTADDSYKGVAADTKGTNRDDIVDACKGITCPAPTQCQQSTYCVKLTGACSFVPKPNGAKCDDNNPLTVEDSCRDGLCVGVDKCKGVMCLARGPCQGNGICDINTGRCSVVTLPDGVNCGDANSKCSKGVCVTVQPPQLCANVICNSTDACKFPGVCDPNTGKCGALTNKPDGVTCDDLNPATVGDKCTAGVCAGVNLCANVNCPQMPCSRSECDRRSGFCVAVAINETMACNDSNPNTENDKCVKGVCVGTPISTATGPSAPSGWTCQPGFYGDGDDCDCGCGIPDPDCGGCTDQGVCSNGGCSVTYNGTHYSSAFCNDTVQICDICAHNPCENNGKCNILDNNGVIDFECSCPPGFTGQNCESNECTNNPCSNGVCKIDEQGMSQCVCKPPYSGDHCEELQIPEGWTCLSTRYLDGKCDCGCGIPDPECSWCQSQCPTGCEVYSTADNSTSYSFCASDATTVMACPNTTQPPAPPEWICLGSQYGDGICDCGCNAIDVDCSQCNPSNCCQRTRFYSLGIKPYQYTNNYGYCNENNTLEICALNPCEPDPCGGGRVCGVDSNNKAVCKCGPGLLEPNCENPCTKTECGNGQCIFDPDQEGCDPSNPSSCTRCECFQGSFGDKCDQDTASAKIPSAWICDPKLFTDKQCTCGCGVIDPACKFCSCSSKQVGCSVFTKDNVTIPNAICPTDKVFSCASFSTSTDPNEVPFNSILKVTVKPADSLCYQPGLALDITCLNNQCSRGKLISANNIDVNVTAAGQHSIASCIGKTTSIPLIVNVAIQPKAQVSLIGTGNAPSPTTLKNSLCSSLKTIPCSSINVLNVRTVQTPSLFKFKFQATGWEAQVVVTNTKSVATVATALNDAAKTKSSPLAALGTLAATARAISGGAAANPIFALNATTLTINSNSSEFVCVSMGAVPACGATNCTSGNTTFGSVVSIANPPAGVVQAIGCSSQGNSNATSFNVPAPPVPPPVNNNNSTAKNTTRFHVSIKNCPNSKCDPVPASECGEGCYLIYFNNEN